MGTCLDLEGEGRMVEGMGRDSVIDELKSETEVKCLTGIFFFERKKPIDYVR